MPPSVKLRYRSRAVPCIIEPEPEGRVRAVLREPQPTTAPGQFAVFSVGDTVLACIVLVAFIITNVCGVQITGRLQNGFMFFFWGVAIIWFVTMVPNVSLPNFVETPDFLSGMGGRRVHRHGGHDLVVLRGL